MKVGQATRWNIFRLLWDWWQARKTRIVEPEKPATLHQPDLGPPPDGK